MKQVLRRHRGIFATLALVSLVSGGAGSSWYFLTVHLPHPRDASPEQLLRWMVQRELRNESPDVQLALVDRLEAELTSRSKLDGVASQLSDGQRRQLPVLNVDGRTFLHAYTSAFGIFGEVDSA